MDDLINQMRGVVGVSGVILYDRLREESKMILPASFEEHFIKSLKLKFHELIRFTSGEAKFRIKLGHGWIVVRCNEKFAVLVIAREDLNISTLELVLKSISMAVEHEAGSQESRVEVIFTEESAFTLLKTINLIVAHFADTLSQFQLAQLLRDSKTELLDHYPDLKHFTVEHNGTVILIKGSESRLDADSVDAVAAWMGQFKKYIKEQTVVAGFNIKSITDEVQPELDSLRFYRKFQQVSS
jgi:hypothetical protein